VIQALLPQLLRKIIGLPGHKQNTVAYERRRRFGANDLWKVDASHRAMKWIGGKNGNNAVLAMVSAGK
jgi:hypothetical protein